MNAKGKLFVPVSLMLIIVFCLSSCSWTTTIQWPVIFSGASTPAVITWSPKMGAPDQQAIADCNEVGMISYTLHTNPPVVYECTDVQVYLESHPSLAQCYATDGSCGDTTATVSPVMNGSLPVLTTDVSHDAWTIKGTDLLVQNPIVADWLAKLQDPAPTIWKVFPNVVNPEVLGFHVADGMEYGTYNSPFCSSHPCDFEVGAREFRYITGDYKFLNTECVGNGKGCMLVLINVSNQSYTWRNQDVDNGFTLRGLYRNGDALEWGVWGLVSNGSANMLNMPTFSHPGEVLNAGGGSANSGANCGHQTDACQSVDVTIVVQAGDAIIAVAKTIVTK
jgi:hypothetical protein